MSSTSAPSNLVPYLDHDGLVLYLGDALAVLRELPSSIADVAVTSPPFYGLRDYGTGRWEGGDPDCEHKQPSGSRQGSTGQRADRTFTATRPYRDECKRCGAKRIDEQVGLEETPEAFVERLVGIFAELRRVLKPHGVLLLEVGDSHSGGNRGAYAGDGHRPQEGRRAEIVPRPVVEGVKEKDLFGIPWALAFALRADGWWLRQEIIWEKTNPMPESVADRCTTAHSRVFHLAKQPLYFWDGEAIREDAVAKNKGNWSERMHRARNAVPAGKNGTYRREYEPVAGRNARSVWTIPTEPSGMGICPLCRAFWPKNSPDQHCGVEVVSHFAAFPIPLAERAILAASSERGVCVDCGAPWERIVEKGEPELAANTWSLRGAGNYELRAGGWEARSLETNSTLKHVRVNLTVGWQPTCECHGHFEVREVPSELEGHPPEQVRVYVPHGDVPDPEPAVVLDCFAGSGTSLVAARKNGRRGIGIELNGDYAEMTARRLELPDAVERAAETSQEPVQLALG